jgi:hypothetical protein
MSWIKKNIALTFAIIYCVIINEFTLVFFTIDNSIDGLSLLAIRALNLIVILIGGAISKNYVGKNFLKNFLIIFLMSVFLFTVLNTAFVYYSPKLVKLFPTNIVRSISPCYRTMFHRNEEKLLNVNYVFGDSFSEGAGEEFLNGDDEYGIFNKLRNIDSNELIFGRGGYGNIGTLLEFEHCFPLLSTYTTLGTSKIENYHVTFVFYEGNDLNNNLLEKDREFSELKYNLRFFFPLYEYTYKMIWSLSRKFFRRLAGNMNTSNNIENTSNNIKKSSTYPVSTSGIQLNLYPQSAATELTDSELNESLTLFFNTLKTIKRILPASDSYMVLYLPAVASSYSFQGDLLVQSYFGYEFHTTTGEFNSERHEFIVDTVRSKAQSLGWAFCDVTREILNQTDKGIAVHGPRDWKHFNKAGYTVVARFYEKCLRTM